RWSNDLLEPARLRPRIIVDERYPRGARVLERGIACAAQSGRGTTEVADLEPLDKLPCGDRVAAVVHHQDIEMRIVELLKMVQQNFQGLWTVARADGDGHRRLGARRLGNL